MNKRKIGLFVASVFLGVSVYSLTSKENNVYASNVVGEEEKLYYGYNVTSGKALMEQDSLQVTFPIIDATKTYNGKTYNDYVSKVVGGTETQFSHISGSSLKSVTKQYVSSIGADIFGKVYTVDTDIATTFDTSNTISNAYQEYYDLYSAYISRYYYTVGLDTEEIRNFLSDKFLSELSSIKSKEDAKNVISRYGTHLITGYTFGGRLNFTNYQSTTSTTLDYSNSMSLSEKVSVSIAKNNAGESASFAEQYQDSENTSTNHSSYSFKSYGGVATSGLTLDSLFTYSESIVDSEKSGFMYSAWIKSINNDKDLAIIGIPNGAQSIPLWQLLDNKSKYNKAKSYLQEAYIELAGDKYEEYQNTYKEMARNIASVDNESVSGVTSTLNGLYVKNGDYFYYVDSDQYSDDSFFVSKDQYLYLDLTETTDLENIDYDTQNCTLINKKYAIFKVNSDASGKCVIRATYGDNVTQVLFSAPVQTNDFEMGYGTDEHPYVITNATQFSKISNDNSYILYNDIDCKDITFTSLKEFNGSFNGNYHKVYNLRLTDNNDYQYFGIFGKNSGTIKNLKLVNVGSAITNDEYEAGSTNYKNDLKNDTYTLNSSKSEYCGIICAINSGTIDNCYVESSYIRNVYQIESSAKGKNISNNTYISACGIICGNNSGTIKNSEVYNSRVLNSYWNDNENLTYVVSIYAGGFVGLLSGGTIQGCVYDSGDQGSVFSQHVTQKSKEGYCYSAAFIGFINSSSTLKNCYIYSRDISENSCQYSFNITLSSEQSRGLRSGSFIIAKGINITYDNIKSNNTNNVTYFTFKALEEGDDYGNNGTNATSCVKELDYISEVKVSSSSFTNLKLDSTYFEYSDNSHNSHIKHLLENDRKNYIALVKNTEEKTMQTEFYVGEIFTLKGLELTQNINGSVTEDVIYFKLTIYDSINESDWDFTNVENTLNKNGKESSDSISNGKYLVRINVEDVKLSDISLKVKDNTLSRIYVDDSESYSIYYDQIDKYIENFGYDYLYNDSNILSVKGVLTNGDIVDISDSVKYITKAKLTLSTNNSDNYKSGSNAITIKYGNNNNSLTTKFILDVVERDIVSVEKLTDPTTPVGGYVSGNTLDLKGMTVKVTYSEGDPVVLSTTEELNSLEVIGDVISFGENEISVSYNDYSETNMFTISLTAKCTIKFVDSDGTLIQSATYSSGETVNAPENPIRESNSTYTYTFAGWDKEIVAAEGDATYTAVYNKEYINYTITFVDYDDSIISTKTYHYGDTVLVPQDPNRVNDNYFSYTFTSWDTNITNVEGDKTYKALYSSAYIDYTIRFIDYNGEILSQTTYHYNDSILEPVTPTRVSDASCTYTFAGWDKEVVNVTGNTNYTATYNKEYINYTVTFKQDDGSVIDTLTYHYNDQVQDITHPTKESTNMYFYTFAGWDKSLDKVTTDIVYTATYASSLIDYTINFLYEDGTLYRSYKYHYGDNVVEPVAPSKKSDKEYTYTFTSWDKALSPVSGNESYKAMYESTYIEYTITFKNYDGSVLSTKTYHYNDTVITPENPIRESNSTYTYTFAGWDKEVSNVTSDTIYTATYSLTYTVSVVDEILAEISAVSSVDLSTYDKIQSIKSKMTGLTDSEQQKINTELNKLITKYNQYVSSINNEYKVAEEIDTNYFGLVSTIVGELTILASCVAIGGKWWL